MKTSTTLQAAGLVMASVAAADFGVTKSGSNYVVDAGSSNPFSITIAGSSCDVTSIKYRGNELQASGGKTQIGSGLGSATVNAATVKSGSTNFVKVTCETSTLTHYIIVKEGEATMYMGTYITAEPSIGELRYLARLNAEILPYEYPFGEASNTAGASSTVEGSDVFVVDGQTRSKFYSSSRFIDTDVYCAYGNGTEAIHACFLPMNKEASSGGPFHRDINSNRAAEDTVNLSWYMNSGHVKTEDFRVGLNGPYLLSFSRSGIPKASEVDTSFFADMDVKGYVADSARGTVTGKATGVSSSFEAVVHWFNDDAQYWTKASSDGSFTSPNMIPGTYTMVLYQTEYKVANATVTVSAGKSTTQNIASTLTTPANSLFKIGEFDGQPFELLNGDKFLRMHPSDSRMSSWTPSTFTVGTSKDNEFPMALFKSVNNGQISFNLGSSPGAATLRIATTLSANGGRPSVSVNGWAASAPAAPVKIDSRGVTRGAYRGYGEQYDIAIPAGKLVAGANNITIGVLSGSTGTGFLNPSFIVDAIELFNNDASSKATSASASTNSAATSSVTEKAEDVTTSKAAASGTNVTTKAALPTGILTFTNDTANSAALSTGSRPTTLQTVVSATSTTLTGSSGSSSTAVSTSAAATKTKSACKAKRSGPAARRRAAHA